MLTNAQMNLTLHANRTHALAMLKGINFAEAICTNYKYVQYEAKHKLMLHLIYAINVETVQTNTEKMPDQ